jgi:Mg/Co/Ni transporter MgtE
MKRKEITKENVVLVALANPTQARDIVTEYSDGDLAYAISVVGDEDCASRFLGSLSNEKGAGIIELLSSGKGAGIIGLLSSGKGAGIIGLLSSGKGAGIIELLSNRKGARIIGLLSDGKKKTIEGILAKPDLSQYVLED